MSEITMGIIITAAACIGALGCLIGLILTAVLFPGQRKKMLEKIESE
ncbi:MAG TPA: hypothetical protein H9909_01780 [Candidatus Mediterraneibacter norfolkensis]|nr:hypothetical protein [Candidatus Mediterraneibacter norfolkensis]